MATKINFHLPPFIYVLSLETSVKVHHERHAQSNQQVWLTLLNEVMGALDFKRLALNTDWTE